MDDTKKQSHPESSNDNYSPYLSLKELAGAISVLGVKKANTRSWQLMLLGILAGLYISLGGFVFLVALDEGLGKIVGGTVFSMGLIFVVVAGAELFTGNIIMIIGTLTLKYRVRSLLRNWLVVYVGNFIGSIITAALIWQSGLLGKVGALNSMGVLAEKIAGLKLDMTFQECFIRGIFCNILVILAIIMATIARDVISKGLCIIFPIMAFVACGFEHCVANMFLIPVGLFAKGMPLLEQGVMFKNILPVTLGNIVGGVFILLIHPNRIRQIKNLLSVKLWHKKPE